MTELERRAMMGDKQAQRDCTTKGIILPCLKCHGEVKISSVGQNGNRLEMGFRCNRCGLELVYGQYLLKGGMDILATENPTPLAQWNDRPEPPIGKCKDCIHYEFGVCLQIYEDGNVSADSWQKRKHDDFCSYFEPRTSDKNER